MFQSLFSWNSPSDVRVVSVYENVALFQSLFSWNSPSDPAWLSGPLRPSPCFNPCFLGTRPRTLPPPTGREAPGKFQSLFSWNSPSDGIYSGISLVSPISFNPCFLGTRPRTSATSTSIQISGSFNPCFLGTRPRTSSCYRNLLIIFMSFNPCFLGTRPRTPRNRRPGEPPDKFQSLFSWNSPSDAGGDIQGSPEGAVSILVFLELALGRP